MTFQKPLYTAQKTGDKSTSFDPLFSAPVYAGKNSKSGSPQGLVGSNPTASASRKCTSHRLVHFLVAADTEHFLQVPHAHLSPCGLTLRFWMIFCAIGPRCRENCGMGNCQESSILSGRSGGRRNYDIKTERFEVINIANTMRMGTSWK